MRVLLGIGKYQPHGNKAAPPIRTAADYPENGDKRAADMETALRKCGLRDGMVISSHHHLRDGDRVALMALEAAARIGVKGLLWFPSASFPSQPHIESSKHFFGLPADSVAVVRFDARIQFNFDAPMFAG